MKIKRVEFRNFNAFPNQTQVLEFPDSSSMIMITGKNGVGKTSILELITFGIYGKVKGKTLKDITNRRNKALYVKIQLESQGKLIEIERGIEPNLFNLQINGKIFDKAGKRSVQEYMEEELFGMPFHVFNNCILLSVNDFKSFIRMSGADKRLIIDRIFGLQIINQMRDEVRIQSKSLRESIDSKKKEITFIQQTIDQTLSELQALNNRIHIKIKDQTKEYTNQIAILKEKENKISTKLKHAENIKRELDINIQNYRNVIANNKEIIRTIDDRINLYTHSKCPMCKGDLSTEFHEQALLEYKEARDKAINNRDADIEFFKKEQEKFQKINEYFKRVLSMKIKVDNQILTYQDHLKKALNKDNPKNDTIDSLQTIIDNQELHCKNVKEIIDLEENKLVRVHALEDMLGESGIKQLAIKTMLPQLNSMIQQLAINVDFPYQVVFNDNFDVSISNAGVDVPVNTLSTGQTKRIDIAVLLAVIRLMKIKFPSINLLFLDEILSSVDHDGRNLLLSILRKHAELLELNIAVVNHTELPTELFDYKIELSLESGFSFMCVQKLD